METIYRKVAVSERMPPPMTDILIKYRWSNYFEPYHYFDDLHCKDEILNEVTHWIEEILDPTIQLKADKAELLEALERCNNELYFYSGQTDFVEENKFLIQKHKQCQENTPR